MNSIDPREPPGGSARLRILLAGVPFGCHNVGDEAILACTVRLLRNLLPEAAITVSTAEPDETARKLQVNTCPLIGFPPADRRFARLSFLRQHDTLIWCGATGLSDYPDIPLTILREAQGRGLSTILWNVGMNSVLNPVHFKILPGKRKRLLSLLGRLALHTVDPVASVEAAREWRVRRTIARRLNAADLVIVRDWESRNQLLLSGVEREVVVGADPALLLEPTKLGQVRLDENVQTLLLADGRKLGVGISTAAPAFESPGRLAECLDRIVLGSEARILFVPMDPISDLDFMENVQRRMQRHESTALLHGRLEPEELLAVLKHLDGVVSSRLHLLILASLADVPFMGISPGSKVDSFLQAHGLQPLGTSTQCDFDALEVEAQRLFVEKEARIRRIRQTRETLLTRLEEATRRLESLLKHEE